MFPGYGNLTCFTMIIYTFLFLLYLLEFVLSTDISCLTFQPVPQQSLKTQG